MNRHYCCWYHSTFVLFYEEERRCSVFFNSFFISTYPSTIDYLFFFFFSISVEFNNKREKEKWRERDRCCVWQSSKLFSLNRHNRNESRFHFLFSYHFFSRFFFSLNRALYTSKQEPKYRQKE